MYVCSSCGCEFEQPEFICGTRIDPPEFVCPVCGQTWDAEEAQMCNLCGEYHHPNDMASEHCCKACAEKRMTLPIMKRYIREDKRRAEFYVDFMLDSKVERASTALLDLAQRHFDGLDALDKVKYLRDFISEDEGDFAAWLEDADNV